MSEPAPYNSSRFMTTRWSEVLAARGNSAQAKHSLRELCDHYYQPVFAFINTYTHHDQNARDWTHAFFAKLLEGHSLATLSQARGRFRSYLLGAVKHFLADEREKITALKRGGTTTHISLDAEWSLDGALATKSMPPDAFFDRQWAVAILDQSLQQLEDELTNQVDSDSFAKLRPWLSGDPTELSQAAVGAQLGLTSAAVKVLIHRIRKKFRAIVKARIAVTVDFPEDVDSELVYLIQALAEEQNSEEGFSG